MESEFGPRSIISIISWSGFAASGRKAARLRMPYKSGRSAMYGMCLVPDPVRTRFVAILLESHEEAHQPKLDFSRHRIAFVCHHRPHAVVDLLIVRRKRREAIHVAIRHAKHRRDQHHIVDL